MTSSELLLSSAERYASLTATFAEQTVRVSRSNIGKMKLND